MTTDVIAGVRAREYRDAGDGIFLNAASYGLLPRSAAEATADMSLRRTRVHGIQEKELGAALRRCRRAVASLLSVDPEEISLAPNTSFGVNLAAALAATGPPGTILLSEGEFSANVYPWMPLEARGFRVEIVPGDDLGRPREDAMLARLARGDVRVLALSAVQFSTGWLADLEAFGTACRQEGILYCVDAIQALGAVPLAPRTLGIDVLASGGQKWLCGPWGSGFVWMDSRHRGGVDPPMVSWLAMEASRDFGSLLDYRWDFLDDGRKFELATLGVQDQLALAHSVELFLEMGVGAVRDHIARVQEPVLAWIAARDDVVAVTPMDACRRAGIVAFRPPRIDAVEAALREAGVICSVREGAVRLSPHFYNTVEEMERVVAVLNGAVA